MESTNLRVDVSEEGGRTVVALRGEFDMSGIELFRDTVEPQMGPRQTIVLDLSGVEFADSSLIKVLLHARTRLTADGGSLILRNPSRAARRILTLAQTQDLVDGIEAD